MPKVSAIIASFVVDVQNQQNYIAHEAIFQRAGNSEGCIGIDYDGKKDSDLYDLEWASRPRRRTCDLYQFKLQASSWLSGILATEIMVLCLACFENQGHKKL